MGSFNRDAVESISSRAREPRWLRERRLAGLAEFERRPLPTRQDEEYRRTDVRRLDLGAYEPADSTAEPVDSARKLAPAARALLTSSKQRGGVDGGVVVQQDGASLFRQLAPDIADQGVIFCSLEQAVREYPEKVQPYLTSDRFGADEDKWSAMNSAFWSGGAFLYVPEGVEVKLPLRSAFLHKGAGGALFSRTLVIAEPWSQVSYIDDYASADGATGFNAGVVDVVAKEGSSVRYCHLQNWGPRVWNFGRERLHAHRDTAINLLQVGLGSQLTKSFVEAHMREPGANVEMLGLVFVGGRQHIDHSTLQNHKAPHCMSDLLFKCALLDEARSVYAGLISIAPGAQRSDAYQNNRNLLLSDSARSHSIPMLEILANDVRCTHGSTSSSVDEEELFYLQSRGLPRNEAERMIVEGFFAPVLERVPLTGVRQRLARAIDAKVSRMFDAEAAA